MFKKSVFIISILFLLFEGAKATPVLSGSIPQHNSYIYGRNIDVFSVNISDDNLDTSTVRLHAKTDDPYAVWATIAMNCYSVSSLTWLCNSTIPTLESLAHDGNWLLYYFDANDTSGNYGNLGSSGDSLYVRIDRSPPNINFTSPIDKGFVSGNLTVSLETFDAYSNIDINTIKYSLDNSTWLPMINTSIITFSQCVKIFCWSFQIFTFNSVEKWNTMVYGNNQTINLYAKAKDVLGNIGYTNIKVTSDNELPRIFIIEPQPNQTLYGTFAFKIQAEDTYSGLDPILINYSIGDRSGIFDCSGSIFAANCTSNFATSSVPDGYHSLFFRASDKAKNGVTNSTFVTIDNLPPKITILSPSPATTVRGNVNVSASVKDDGVGVANVSFRIESGSAYGDWKGMSCVADYCSAIWNSSTVVDGTYTIRIQSSDKIGRTSSMPIQVSIVNAQGSQASTTTTITTATTAPSSLEKYTDTFSKFLDKIWKNPILALGLILPLIFLSVIYFISRRKPAKTSIPRAKGIAEKYLEDFDRIQNTVFSSLSLYDIDSLKDRVRLAIIYLEKFEKNFMEKTIRETLDSIRDKDVSDRVKKCFDERNDEIKNIQKLKIEYLDEIVKSFSDVLKIGDIVSARRNLEDTMNLLRKYRNLVDREIAILSDCLSRANVK